MSEYTGFGAVPEARDQLVRAVDVRANDAERVGAVPAPMCACGCGQPTSGRFSTTTGEPVRYRPGHFRGRHVPMSDSERRTILEEIASGVGWTESYIGVVRPVSADAERVRGALGHTMKCFNASPTLRRVLARLASASPGQP